MELKSINKVGEKTLLALNNLSIYNIDDLIRYYPYRFDVISRKKLDDPKNFDNMITDGIINTNAVVSFFKGKNRLSFSMVTQNKIVKVIIFNRLFIKNKIIVGNDITVIGKYNINTNTIIANNILFERLSDKEKIYPIYHQSHKINSKKLNLIINDALKNYELSFDLPLDIRQKYSFMNLNDAIKIVHNPQDVKSLKEAVKVLKYEELFSYLINIKKLKEKNEEKNDLYKKQIDITSVENFIKTLPFELTKDQRKVIDDMLFDMKSNIKMNRLLQGDVSSGKTIVCFILAYANKTANFQSVLMAPTEILAVQHYYNALKLFKDEKFNIALLTGKTKNSEKKKIYEQIKNNEIDFLIGTHALLNDNLEFNNLGLVITDEQHRFGVNQRLKLKNKSNYPDTLMMSATPIPRTYALTLYGDTNVSSIKTMPNGRIPVETMVKKTEELKDVLKSIYNCLKNNNQVYVISPMIEENENSDYTNVFDLEKKFNLAFKNYNVKVMHGKMTSEEKDKIMKDYIDNKINILISTTVVEVGVDNPNSSMIVIFDADRFGLSTLHQLRGRVGRSSIKSYCYLISDKDSKRLKIMENETDGFKISEADFKLRGEGDLFGNKQSGLPNFKLSNIKKDYDLIKKVKDDIDKF